MTDYNVDVTISVDENQEPKSIKRTIQDKLEHHVNGFDDVLVTKTEKLTDDITSENMAEKKIAKHKKHGWSYEKQLKELKKTEKSYSEKGMELSPIQQKRKQLLNEKIDDEVA